jgi:hypothetical protein
MRAHTIFSKDDLLKHSKENIKELDTELLTSNEIRKSMMLRRHRTRATTFRNEAPASVNFCHHRKLVKDGLIAGLLYSIGNYVYYGSVFGLSSLKGNIYFYSIFSTIGDLAGFVLISVTLSKCKRKHVFFVSFVAITLASFSFFFIKVPGSCDNNST